VAIVRFPGDPKLTAITCAAILMAGLVAWAWKRYRGR
jgi:hypothetical protein